MRIFSSALRDISVKSSESVVCERRAGSDAMRVFTRARRLRFSRKVCLVIIPVGWLTIFITLSLYSDHENSGKFLYLAYTFRATMRVFLSQVAVRVLVSL